MSIATKQPRALRRIWKVPSSKMRWFWLAGTLVLYVIIFLWYNYAIKTQQDPEPINDPLRLFGIIAFLMVLGTAAYALRRRFVRGLPGKVQAWLWMHTWVGVATILIAFMHENYAHITHDFCTNLGCLTDTYWATGALFALIFLVISGIAGRLLDRWQTRVIALDASNNGVGIMRALEERILEQEYIVERLCAGKSEPFKQFCLRVIETGVTPPINRSSLPAMKPSEYADFQKAYETLVARQRLVESLKQQERARKIMRTWRSVHMVLATIALLIIIYHGMMEILANVIHVITPS